MRSCCRRLAGPVCLSTRGRSGLVDQIRDELVKAAAGSFAEAVQHTPLEITERPGLGMAIAVRTASRRNVTLQGIIDLLDRATAGRPIEPAR